MLRLFVLTFIQSIFIFANASSDTTSSFNIAQFVRELKIRSGFNTRTWSVAVNFQNLSDPSHNTSSSTLGVGLRQSFTLPHSLGYSWGANLEALNPDNLYFLNVDPSVSYGINRTAYLLAGFNYAFPFTRNILGTELSGSFGYQAGGGLLLGSKWNIEAIYRDIGFHQESAARDLDRLSYSGLLLRANYAL